MTVQLFKQKNSEFDDFATLEEIDTNIKITWWQFGEPNGHEHFTKVSKAHKQLSKFSYQLASPEETIYFESQVANN